MYYNEILLVNLKRKRLISIIISLILLIVVIGVCVILCFFANRENQRLIQIATITITTIGLWIIIFLYDTEIFINNTKIKHVKLMTSSTFKEVSGKVLSIGEIITLSSKVRGREIFIEVDRKSLCLYLLDEFLPNFNIGDSIEVKIVQQFIIYSEVKYE